MAFLTRWEISRAVFYQGLIWQYSGIPSYPLIVPLSFVAVWNEGHLFHSYMVEWYERKAEALSVDLYWDCWGVKCLVSLTYWTPKALWKTQIWPVLHLHCDAKLQYYRVNLQTGNEEPSGTGYVTKILKLQKNCSKKWKSPLLENSWFK